VQNDEAGKRKNKDKNTISEFLQIFSPLFKMKSKGENRGCRETHAAAPRKQSRVPAGWSVKDGKAPFTVRAARCE